MPSRASQVIIIQYSDGFLNGLVPDFARMLDDKLSSSSTLGSVLSERSYRVNVRRSNQWCGGRPINKALIEKYLKYLYRQEYPPPTSPAFWPPSAGTSTAFTTCPWTMPPCAACCFPKSARPSLKQLNAAWWPGLRGARTPSASKPARMKY